MTIYQVGGSLREGTEIYVSRQADQELYEGLQAGVFCYVLNSRQMGKSSLRVRTMARLRSQGFICIAFEMRELCVYQVTADEFYGGFVSHFASELSLDIDLEAWWSEHALLHPFQRLSKFIEEILLEHITQRIFVFVDEIDSILNLEFKDDFFAFVRSCYNKRANKPEFQRLTFAMFGVATPTDLIEDSNFTPLNVESQAIELTGFQLHEAKPLEQGIAAENPTKVMAEILAWTGGQPFLTQWVCQLVNASGNSIASGFEAQAVESIVRSQIIEHWLAHDRQQHFQTIRDRILNHKSLACWSLGLYQQLLNQGELSVEDSLELMQFRLSGLVVKRQGKLSIYNRIYASVFDQTWTEQSLRAIRPYGAELAAWEVSQDPKYLLQDDTLEWALTWAKGLSLSHSDYQFLSASQAQELAIAQSNTQTAIQRLGTVKHQTKKRLRVGAIALAASFVGTLGTFFYFRHFEQQLRTNAAILNLEREGSRILQGKADANQIKDLLAAMKSAQELQQLTQQHSLKQLPTQTPLFALQSVLSTVQEQNQWKLDGPAVAIAFSRDNQQIATAGEDGIITLWTAKGTRLKTIKTAKTNPGGLPTSIYALSFSPDGRFIATANAYNDIQVWNTQNGTMHSSVQVDRTKIGNVIANLQVTADNHLIIVSDAGRIAKWNLLGKQIPMQQIEALKKGRDFGLSLEGDAIAFTNANGNPEVRDLKTGNLIKTYPNLKNPLSEYVQHSFYSQAGVYIAANLNTIKIWNLDGTLRSEIKTHQMFVSRLGISFDGSAIATSHPDGSLKLWTTNSEVAATPIESPRIVGQNQQRLNRIQLPDGTRIAGKKADYRDRMTEASLSPDGRTIAAIRLNGELAFYQSDGKLLKTIQTDLPESNVKFSPDGSHLVLLSLSQKKLQIRFSQGNLIKEMKTEHHKPGIEFSPDGKWFAIAGPQPDQTQLWSIDGQKLRDVDADTLLFSPNRNTYITVSSGNTPTRTVRLWTREGQLLKTLSGHPNEITAMKFSPTGQFAISDRYGKLAMWDADGNLLRSIDHGAAVFDIAYQADGQQFATVGADQTIKLWRQDGTLIRTLETNLIGPFQFSPDGQLLVAKTIDSTLHIWQSDGTPITQIKMGDAFNAFLNFTPDGRLISSSGSSLYSWNLNLDQLLAEGCAQLSNYFRNHPEALRSLQSCAHQN